MEANPLPPPAPLSFPEGSNDDVCTGGPSADTFNNCETEID